MFSETLARYKRGDEQDSPQFVIRAKPYPIDSSSPAAQIETSSGAFVAGLFSRAWTILVWDSLKHSWVQDLDYFGAVSVNRGGDVPVPRYDTYSSSIRSAQQAAFVDTINQLKPHHIAIIVGSHAPEHYDSRMREAIVRCGGTPEKLQWTSRSSYICIGYFDSGEGSAIREELNNVSYEGRSNCAETTIRFLTDGLNIRSNGVSSLSVSEVGITDGMVAWLPLKHDDKNLCNNDLSSGGHDGTFLFSNGQVGADFDGTNYNGIVFYPTVNVNSGDEWTMMCWVYLRQFNNNNYPIFMSTGVPYLAVNSSGGQLRCSYSDGSQVNATSSKSLNANQWYHVCATFKAGDGVRLYCDSVQVAHRTSPTSTSSIDSVRLGGHNPTRYKVDGIVGDSKVFNRSLSAEEIAVEYKRSGPTKMTQYNGGIYLQGQLKEVIA